MFYIPLFVIILVIVIGLLVSIEVAPKTRKVYIIRGIPGSGKSTLAVEMAAQLGINYFEADQYFYLNPEGTYQFDIEKLMDAHRWCEANVLTELHNDRSVIVSNTFTRWKEMRAYIDMAHQYKYEVEVIEVKGDYGSIHGVPPETMEKMRARWIPNYGLPQMQGIVYRSYPI